MKVLPSLSCHTRKHFTLVFYRRQSIPIDHRAVLLKTIGKFFPVVFISFIGRHKADSYRKHGPWFRLRSWAMYEVFIDKKNLVNWFEIQNII